MGFSGNIQIDSDVVWNGVITVDAVNGDDATGQRNLINKSFATIAAAYAVYQEGDVIRVLPGTYTFTSTLVISTFNEVHFDFFEGAVVTGDIVGPLFSSTTGTLRAFIHGRGEFINTNLTLGITTAAIFNAGRLNVMGAKRIHCESGTLFSPSNGWELIQNVDEMTATLGYVLNGTTNDFTTVDKGIVRNCKKIGDLAHQYGIFIQIGADDSLVFENCNIFASGALNGYSVSISTSNAGKVEMVDCNIICDTFRSLLATGFCKFNNCHIQQNSGAFEACITIGTAPNDIVFTDCTFAHFGTGRAIRTAAPCRFEGVNKFYSESGVEAAYGLDADVNMNDGTIYANIMQVDGSTPVQTWIFQVNTDPPTVGEIYTITAPNGTDSISYTVQPADTRDDVVNGLFAAWDVEVAADPDGYFADFDNKTVTLGPVVWRLNCTALNSDDNLDPNNGFVLSTNGADSVQTIPLAITAFAWKGDGKFMIDENMTIQQL